MRRKLGQHFLIQQEVVGRILSAATIAADDIVLEIGPGKGSVTRFLAKECHQLIALEYDSALVSMLHEKFTDEEHVFIVHGDARRIDYSALFEEYKISPSFKVKIVANLPYYAATHILLQLCRNGALFSDGILMFQKEVAERITASPGNKAYGSLSIFAQYYTIPTYCFTVPSRAFFPPPKVESAVIKLHFRKFSEISVLNEKHFFQLVKDAFLSRRKTLFNALSKNNPALFPANILEEGFNHLQFSKQVRAEQLAINDFASLSNFFVSNQPVSSNQL